MKKRLLSMILALSMMLTILPVNAITAWAADDGLSGNCGKNGDNVTYTLTQNNDDSTNPTYTLTIKGDGEMENYNRRTSDYAPWFSVKEKITEVAFSGNITTIGRYAFFWCTGLTSITIPDSVTSIGDNAFNNCQNLENITMPDDSNSSLKTIGSSAFEECKRLTSITIPSSVTSIGNMAFNVHHIQNSLPLKVYFPAELPNNIGSSLSEYIDVEFYYPGYKNEWDAQKNKIDGSPSWPEDVLYYCDVTISANGGEFEAGQETKVFKKIWRKANLTQEQVNTIGVPQKTGKVFSYWGTSSNGDISINDLTTSWTAQAEDGKVIYAIYRDAKPATVTIGDSNKTFKAGTESDAFTVTATKGDTEAAKVKFEFANGTTVQYKETNGSEWTAVPADGVEIANLSNMLFRIATSKDATVGTTTLTAKLVDTDGNEITGATASATFTVTALEHATVTISGLDTDNAVKAGKDKTFTVSVTPNDDANTGAKATIEVSGANTDAVDKIQYKDGETWKNIPNGGLSIDDINNTEFKLITKADANDGDVTITVAAKKADGTEIDKKDATITVKKHENAKVTISGLDTDYTVKAGNDKTFTVKVDPKDDAGTDAKVTVSVDGTNKDAVEKIQYKDADGWHDMRDEGLGIDKVTGDTEFKIITKPGADNGNATITVAAKKADGTEIDKKDATITVKKHENATVTISGLDDDLKQGESKDFTVKVDPKDDSGKATIDFGDKNSEIQYKDPADGQWKDMTGGLEIDLDDGAKDYEFRITPKDDGDQTLTATVKQGDTELGQTKKDFTVEKKDEPTIPGGGETGGGDKPGTGENPGGGETGGGDKPGTGENPGGGETGGGDKPGTGENPGGGETGGGDKPGTGENPGGDGGNTKPGDGDHTGDKDPETKSYELTVIGGSFTAKQGENALTVETTKADNSLTAKIPEGAVVTVTLNKDAVPEGMVFDQWKINDDDLMGNPEVAYDQETFHFTMPEHDVKVEVMYRDATIESDGPGILGTGAMIATVGISAAALAYQGHMLGTEFALRCMLPEWALIPQNRAELAVLLWQDADSPEPVSTNLYSDISEDDSAIQKAARWAVENDLMELLDAEEAPENFDPFVPVTYLDSIHAWKKAQELKK